MNDGILARRVVEAKTNVRTCQSQKKAGPGNLPLATKRKFPMDVIAVRSYVLLAPQDVFSYFWQAISFTLLFHVRRVFVKTK